MPKRSPKSPSLDTLRQRVITAAKRWVKDPGRTGTMVPLVEALDALEAAERKHRTDQCRVRRVEVKVLSRVRVRTVGP